MKKTSVIGTLLTLLMFLLVLVAAVFFLADRQQDLEASLADAQAEQETLAATRDQLASDLAVRQAAFDSVEGTRAALASQLETDAAGRASLEMELQAAQDEVTDLSERLSERGLEVFVFSPKEGAILPPGQAIELIVAAHADETLESLTVTVNDLVLDSYPVQGQARFTNRIPWTPSEEGAYSIEVTATSADERTATATVQVEAVYLSQEERLAGLLEQVSADLAALRFPQGAPAPPPDAPAPRAAESAMPAGFEAAEPFSRTLFLRAFDLIPADFDLAAFEAAAEQQPMQVTYDAQAGAAVAFSLADAPDPAARWLVARQAARDLQETYLNRDEAVAAATDQDGRLALAALAEGEGAFLQQLYAQGGRLNSAEAEAVRQALALAPPDYLAEAPDYARQRLLFPVAAGYPFVEAAFDEDGFGGLDALWQRPPLSSEQILHPDRYQTGELPIPTTLAPAQELLADGWQLAVADSLGEFHLGQYLGQQLDAETSAAAAAGWGGGRYAVYWQPEDDGLALLVRLAWDNVPEGQEFEQAFGAYAAARTGAAPLEQPGGATCWPADITLCLAAIGPDTLIVRAPDVELALELLASQSAGPTP